MINFKGHRLVVAVSEQEVDGLAFFVNGTVQILPLAFDLDVGFVNQPNVAYAALLIFPE
jgi:hypothetical protein